MWLLCEVDLSQCEICRFQQNSSGCDMFWLPSYSKQISGKLPSQWDFSTTPDGWSRQAHDELESLRSRARRRLEAATIMIRNHASLGLFSISLACSEMGHFRISRNQEIKRSICLSWMLTGLGSPFRPCQGLKHIQRVRMNKLDLQDQSGWGPGFPNELAMKHWIMSQIQRPSSILDDFLRFHLQPLEEFEISTCPQEKVQLLSSERWNFVVTVGKSGENFWYKASLMHCTVSIKKQT